jgi:demethylmenaquinone methyltransferase/2-methoxy-6-polyprenyl-1,4-benzoquinol methylase
MPVPPSSATDPATAAHCERRAGEYDEWYTGHVSGHLPADEWQAFLTEARRVAGRLVVVDSDRRHGVDPDQWQERVLNDGSRHRVSKRYVTGDELAAELGGEVLWDGDWFVAAGVSW